MTANVCECGHGKSDHVLLSRECRNPDPVAEDCVCTKFRPGTPPSVGWEPPAGLGEKLTAATKRFGEQLDRESTSARLARVTAERDDLTGRLRQMRELRADAIAAVVNIRKERNDLASLAEGFRRTIAELTAERDEAKAALLNLAAGEHLTRAADVVTAYDCLYCRTCYGRYFDGTDAADNHEHPLVPVQVTITLREGHR